MSAAPKQAERAYKLHEAAEVKAVSTKTLTRAIKDGSLTARRLPGGREYRIAASALDAWFDGLEST